MSVVLPSAATPAARRAARPFSLPILVAGLALVAAEMLIGDKVSEYYFLAAYVILQYVVLATGWNILGGYAGYVNFGTAGFFAVGCYTTIALENLVDLPLPVAILGAGVVAGLLGLGTGFLTLRLRGVFFSIATLALAVVLQTLIVNWSFVGGSRGAYMLRPDATAPFASYVQYLLVVMTALATFAVLVAVAVERSWVGMGLAAIRDDELAAEASGVPGLRLKLLATTLCGALMGMAGAPFPYFITYVDPPSVFSLAIAVNAIAMPLIGGTAAWWGPVLGAILLGATQQVLTVTISSAANLLIVGIVLVVFVTVAPTGVVGLVRAWQGRRS
ncbi:MAG: branched-chain amino acid transporter permease [Xanthobacteraceae bacterium]|jgi:branched-chain amino acid transport system permease protein|nr:branched-chain amino acid transporter permease [Xanthobacteraceae bacterium]